MIFLNMGVDDILEFLEWAAIVDDFLEYTLKKNKSRWWLTNSREGLVLGGTRWALAI